jgi:pyruvate ferredoxin oxidoreductase delta subunit
MKQKGWKDLPPGSIVLEGGSAARFKTGSWRAFRPVWIEENCINCLFCWVFCPDMSVKVKDGKMIGFDYDFCKGCGICALECPGKKGKKAIEMAGEGT